MVKSGGSCGGLDVTDGATKSLVCACLFRASEVARIELGFGTGEGLRQDLFSEVMLEKAEEGSGRPGGMLGCFIDVARQMRDVMVVWVRRRNGPWLAGLVVGERIIIILRLH